jgi:thiol-disulfide isomerase/thioredoxin
MKNRARNDVNLKKPMKKTTKLIVMALLCLKKTKAVRPKLKACLLITSLSCLFNGQLLAQDARPLKIDDKIPAAFWTANRSILTKEQTLQKNLHQYKGKAVVLDFWATWCGACLNQFPKMNVLQRQFAKNLQFLLINNYAKDTPQVLRSFLQQQDEDFGVPILAQDEAMAKMFPVKSIPHYIWIGADGRIKAITTADAVTAANLKRLIAGLELYLALKTN